LTTQLPPHLLLLLPSAASASYLLSSSSLRLNSFWLQYELCCSPVSDLSGYLLDQILFVAVSSVVGCLSFVAVCTQQHRAKRCLRRPITYCELSSLSTLTLLRHLHCIRPPHPLHFDSLLPLRHSATSLTRTSMIPTVTASAAAASPVTVGSATAASAATACTTLFAAIAVLLLRKLFVSFLWFCCICRTCCLRPSAARVPSLCRIHARSEPPQ